MTEDSAGSPGPASPRLSWRIDHERRVLVIECRGGVSDDDLLADIPSIWKEHPEVIGYDSVVDARGLTGEGGWTWRTLREIARQWREFSRGGDSGRRTAIVTTDVWVEMLAGAFVLDYRGRRFRCFGSPGEALEWLAPEPAS